MEFIPALVVKNMCSSLKDASVLVSGGHWPPAGRGIQAPWKMAKKFLQGAPDRRPLGPAVAEHGAPLGARMQIWFINDGRLGRPS
jgi:hypothetical protein